MIRPVFREACPVRSGVWSQPPRFRRVRTVDRRLLPGIPQELSGPTAWPLRTDDARGIPVRVPGLLLMLLVGAACFVAGRAEAFENQWHLGGALGIAKHARVDGVAPLVGVYGAYGLSDMFDLRLELGATRLHADGERVTYLSQALGGVTYKLDVIQLIPYGGVLVGASRGTHRLDDKAKDRFEPTVSLLFGLDYALSRATGLGLAVGLHAMPFEESGDATASVLTTVLLRAEHRFGW